jgi:ectoine hydroxylase
VSAPGRGNLKVVPGSHRSNWIDGPPRRDVRWPDPPGATEVCVRPGDALLFDRRLWHCRTVNHSAITRKAMFFGYTLRWIVSRDEPATQPPDASLSPVRRQLLDRLGEPAGDHSWGHDPHSTPLYDFLAEHGNLTADQPPLRP